MSKVLVDRELLERCVDRWACCAIVETPGAEQAWLELREVAKTAQPAEGKGVDRNAIIDEVKHAYYERKSITEAVDAICAALSAVTAERDRLREANASRSDKLNEARSIIDQLRAEVEALRGRFVYRNAAMAAKEE